MYVYTTTQLPTTRDQIYRMSGDDSLTLLYVDMHEQGIKSFARARSFTNNLEDHFWTDARVRADFLVRGADAC